MKYKILLTLFAVSLIFSVALAALPTEKICGDQTSSCSIVQNSNYKKTLGVNNSILGIIAFSFLIVLTILQIKKSTKKKQNLLALTLLISSLAAIHFIYLQIFVIKALCPYCMIIDTSTILATIILIIKK